MNLMDSELVGNVTKMLEIERDAIDKQQKQRDGICKVLGDIVRASELLKENKNLDNAIEKKAKALNDLELLIETRSKDAEDEVVAQNKQTNKLKADISGLENAYKEKNKEADKSFKKEVGIKREETDVVIRECDKIVKDATDRKLKAISECDAVENKRRLLKEEVAKI